MFFALNIGRPLAHSFRSRVAGTCIASSSFPLHVITSDLSFDIFCNQVGKAVCTSSKVKSGNGHSQWESRSLNIFYYLCNWDMSYSLFQWLGGIDKLISSYFLFSMPLFLLRTMGHRANRSGKGRHGLCDPQCGDSPSGFQFLMIVWEVWKPTAG